MQGNITDLANLITFSRVMKQKKFLVNLLQKNSLPMKKATPSPEKLPGKYYDVLFSHLRNTLVKCREKVIR
uniref:Uncharacterized protein n=1 Tax=Sphaerodactylus townsendi TaxID=933632 RepID=A0ACB8F8F1_9SAUR